MDYEVLLGDCIESMKQLPDESVDMCVTSPPYYGLRNYGNDEQIGLEATLGGYLANMVAVFEEVRRILKPHGTLWLNLGDSYNGSGGAGGDYAKGGMREGQPKYPGRNEPTMKRKELMGVPWRVAFALSEAGWYLRQDIIWNKPNCMPEPVKDRCTKTHEYFFLLTKQEKYYFDNVAIKEPVLDASLKRAQNSWDSDHPSTGFHGNGIHTEQMGKRFVDPAGRNKRSVWTITPKPFKGAHFAVYPPELIEPCILAGTSAKGNCSSCGKPWQRVYHKPQPPKGLKKKSSGNKMDYHTQSAGGGAKVDEWYNANPGKTLGWQPTCECHGKLVMKEVVIPALMTKEEVGETNWGSKTGEYNGHNTKDFASANAQSASDTKRRIIENRTKDKVKKMLVYESDLPLDEHPITKAVVFDPFGGSGTTAGVAIKHGRKAILCELNPEYAELIPSRIESISQIQKETLNDTREWL